QSRDHLGDFAGRPRSRGMGSGPIGLPRLHGDSRIEPGDSIMRAPIALAVAAILIAGSPALAQSWEASGLAGLTPSAPIDERSVELSDLDIRRGFTWGFQGARSLTPTWVAEVLWTQQDSALEVGNAGGKADL